MHDDIPIYSKTSKVKAYLDLKNAVSMSPVFWGLAMQDIKQRYRRSMLGPLWITASTGVMVGAMGPLYGLLLGQSVGSYTQYLAISIVLWMFISTTVNEAGNVFVGSENFIKQVYMPLSVFVYRMLARNLIMMAHNLLVVLLVLLVLPPAHFHTLWIVPLGFILVVANLTWIVFLLGLLGTRFRDIPQIVINLVQVAFFMSPIIWRADMLGPNAKFLADFNPLYHFMEIVRAPLLGEAVRGISWLVSFGLLLVGGVTTFLAFARLRWRVPYWL